MRNKYLVGTLCFISFLSLPVLYQNCGSTHEGSLEQSSAAVLKPLFRDTFHPFLQTNCSSCHVRNGDGNGRFASSTLEEAYTAFSYMGANKIAEYAVSASHNYPFSGPQHEETVNSIMNAWKEGLEDREIEEDTEIYEVEPQFVMNTKILGFSESTNREMAWNLGEHVVSVGAENQLDSELRSKLMITSEASLITNVTGQIGYALTAPRLHVAADAGTDLRMTGAIFNLNGKLIKRNTFYSLSVCVRAGESGTISASGSIFYERRYVESDRIGIALMKVEKTLCPDPEQLPKVSFNMSSTVAGVKSIKEGSVGDISTYAGRSYPTVEIQVQLDQAPTTPVFVGVILSNEIKNNVKPRCCIRLDNDLSVRRGDWDFDFSRVDLVFNPPKEGDDAVLTQTILIPISDDERQEADEVFTLVFDNVVNATDGIDNEISVKILDASDFGGADRSGGFTLPDGTWFETETYMTYDELYTNIFNSPQETKRCIGCHNSVIRAAGYDVTDYKQMLQTGVIKPMDRNNSDLIRRIVDWNLLGLNPMPLNEGGGQNGTPPEWHADLERWIMSGARNN